MPLPGRMSTYRKFYLIGLQKRLAWIALIGGPICLALSVIRFALGDTGNAVIVCVIGAIAIPLGYLALRNAKSWEAGFEARRSG